MFNKRFLTKCLQLLAIYNTDQISYKRSQYSKLHLLELFKIIYNIHQIIL